jgi:hypothetical protein
MLMVSLFLSLCVTVRALYICLYIRTEFSSIGRPCCGSGDFGETGCSSNVELCQNRSSFFFWDRFHPTEAVSALTSIQLFCDNGTFVHPINVQQLVASSRP